jgi:hypothetical protein
MNKIVGCEIELKNGQTCGIQAIGRCATCERAFCMTHQGYSRNTFGRLVPDIDMCELCAAAKWDEERKRQEEADAPTLFFRSGTAVTTLRKSGVRSVKIYIVVRQMKASFFGDREIEYPKLIGRGWVLGKFTWQYKVQIPYDTETVVEDWVTVLMDSEFIVPGVTLSVSKNQGLIRVQPYSDGYEKMGNELDWFAGSMELAGQAVRRLAGVTS